MPQAGLAMANPETEKQPLAVDDNKKVGGEASDSDEDNDVGTPEVSRAENAYNGEEVDHFFTGAHHL
jgi:hypothetical protein